MKELFLSLVNISITAGYLILAAVLLRLLLARAPKWIRGILWALVGVRLIFPFSLESALSLIPSAETVPQSVLAPGAVPAVTSGFPAVDGALNPVLSAALEPETAPGAGVPLWRTLADGAWIVWLAGLGLMLLYAVISTARIRRSVREAVPGEEKGVWLCDAVRSPFILGVIRPRIYLPSLPLGGETESYLIAHEKAHLRRGDHLWKPLGFLLLCVYWFNPLCWLAYVLLCRDIELACDERVIRDLDRGQIADYSEALLRFSVPRRRIAACPLAFGEVGVKTRIRSALSYKKPAFWIVIAALLACVAAAVCLLTVPKKPEADPAADPQTDERQTDERQTDGPQTGDPQSEAPQPADSVSYTFPSFGQSDYAYRYFSAKTAEEMGSFELFPYDGEGDPDGSDADWKVFFEGFMPQRLLQTDYGVIVVGRTAYYAMLPLEEQMPRCLHLAAVSRDGTLLWQTERDDVPAMKGKTSFEDLDFCFVTEDGGVTLGTRGRNETQEYPEITYLISHYDRSGSLAWSCSSSDKRFVAAFEYRDGMMGICEKESGIYDSYFYTKDGEEIFRGSFNVGKDGWRASFGSGIEYGGKVFFTVQYDTFEREIGHIPIPIYPQFSVGRCEKDTFDEWTERIILGKPYAVKFDAAFYREHISSSLFSLVPGGEPVELYARESAVCGLLGIDSGGNLVWDAIIPRFGYGVPTANAFSVVVVAERERNVFSPAGKLTETFLPGLFVSWRHL